MSVKRNVLEEVKADAAFNYMSRLQAAQQRAAHEEAKQKGLPTPVSQEKVVEPVKKEGK